MFWRGFKIGIAGVVLAGFGAVGCLNSEADYQALLEDNDTLSAELDEARRENEILSRALDDIQREQETLQLLLNAGKSSLASSRASLPASPVQAVGDQAQPAAPEERPAPRPPAPAPPPAAGGRVYVTKPGDVLTNIAQAQRTTVAMILELNPHLRQRRNYMIYENERLRLP